MPRVQNPEDRAASRSQPVDDLIRQLEAVRHRLRSVESRLPRSGFGPSRVSARNLIHYVALRHFDLRKIQGTLADLGLSSMGRAESHVLYNTEIVLQRLHSLRGDAGPSEIDPTALTPEQGRRRLARHAAQLFGRPRPGRDTRIMVTVPIEAARDPALVRDLLAGGMDCMRINCAHDSERDWEQMIRNLRGAVRETGIPCRVEMDLGGPRLRTGPIEPGPSVVKVRPLRDPLGRVLRPARVALFGDGRAVPRGLAVDARLQVPTGWLKRRHIHERLRLRDARGARRTLRVEKRRGEILVASLSRTTYFTNGVGLEGHRRGGGLDRGTIGGIPPTPGRIRLAPGDRLILSRGPELGHDSRPGSRGDVGGPSVGVTLPEVLGRLRVGDRIWFDGGRIGGVVRSRRSTGILVRIDHTSPGGAWLRADQGINFPDTDLGLPPLTDQDRKDLPFLARNADLVGYSFVQSPHDIEILRDELRRLERPDLGIVLKIETRRAFEQLPAILLAGLRAGPVGVMIARGDLAVEVGFERLAEVQEETLWLCEAAHLPTIWATEVLEGFTKGGLPTRAEVTDAAMGERAECVMLNKGPYLVSAVRSLDSILRRMQAHQAKKSARLRHLNVAERFLGTDSRFGVRDRVRHA